MLRLDLFRYRIRKGIARVVAKRRLHRLFRNRKKIKLSEEEFGKIVESLSEAMCESGIFKQRRIKNFKDKFCGRCLYRKESGYGDWCILRDVWMKEIKDEYCGGFTERNGK